MSQFAIAKPNTLTALPPLTLYVHFPWCVRKCPYCDFNSHEIRSSFDEAAYIQVLFADLEAALPSIWGRLVHSIFIGGGTPSLMSAEGLAELISGLRARLKLTPFAEITIEANPGASDAQKFQAFRAAGINRLSIGVQSFDDKNLMALGRIHDGQAACAAVEAALTYFDNVNVDLMYALSNQTLAAALADIEQALRIGVTHLSAYHLTLEPNTYFYHHRPAHLPDDDTSADMQEAIEARLAGAGLEHYETSAFAKPGQRCLHNLNYWCFGDYLGIGAGAHSKISHYDAIERLVRVKQPAAYMRAAATGQAISRKERITRHALPFEFMMNALRLNEGFDIVLFTQRTGLTMAILETALNKAQQQGLIERDLFRIKPTLRGQRFLNDLISLFLYSPEFETKQPLSH